jgi:hypothetical protein
MKLSQLFVTFGLTIQITVAIHQFTMQEAEAHTVKQASSEGYQTTGVRNDHETMSQLGAHLRGHCVNAILIS